MITQQPTPTSMTAYHGRDMAFSLLIVAISLLVGVIGIKLNGNRFSPDSTGFHNYAVNIAANRWYTSDYDTNPQIKLNREPGYPMFLGAIYRTYSSLGRVSYIKSHDYDLKSGQLLTSFPETYTARFIQAIMLALGVLLFYRSIIPFFPRSICRTAVLVLALYYPYQVYASFLLREPLVAFLTVANGYILSRYLISKKPLFLYVSSVILAIGTLVWQAYLAFTLIIPVIIWFKERNVSKVLKYSIFSGVIFVLLVSPWLAYSYSYYRDLRVMKSLGTTYTHELMGYVSAMDEAVYYKAMSSTEKRAREDSDYYNLSSQQVFHNSFSGFYSAKSDSIRALLRSKGYQPLAYRMNAVKQRLSNLFYQTNWSPFDGPKGWSSMLRTIKDGKPLKAAFSVFTVSVSLGLGILSILGIFLVPRKTQLTLLPFGGFVVFFYPIGSVSRRFMPIIPWLILLGMVAIYTLGKWILNRKSLQLIPTGKPTE